MVLSFTVLRLPGFWQCLVIAMAILLLPVRAAQAVQLAIMNVATHATNSVIPAGEEVVTFGIQLSESDLIGAGTNPVLLVQNLAFVGNGIVPSNATGTANKVDVQDVQSSVVDPYAAANSAPAQQSNLSTSDQQSLYADSWWYNSGSGVLQGVNDDSGLVGPLTNPAWQLGPIKNVGPTGFTWNADGTPGVQAGDTALSALASPSGTNATTGQYMIFNGIYGPNGSNTLTGSTLASQFVNGILTVPIAQIATTGDISIPGDYSNAAGAGAGRPGTGTFIDLIGTGVSNGPTGNGTYNVFGGNPNIDPICVYNFGAQQFNFPEPGTFVLAGIAAVGVMLRSKHLRVPRRGRAVNSRE
ncbi:MAG TPA: hypothetical protein VGN12_26590 [Pirellulales bacterium]|jgi:hypothetical protein